MKAIIADDNERNVEYLSDILSKVDGIELVGKAKDGEEELQLIRELKPDVVLTDNDMPKYKGIEVIETIKKELNNDAPIFIMITGDMEKSLINKMIELEVASYLRKPIDEKRLIEELESIMRPPEKNVNITFQKNRKESFIKRILSRFK